MDDQPLTLRDVERRSERCGPAQLCHSSTRRRLFDQT